MIAGVVLAAGLSSRLGRPKQLLEAGGRILLAHVLEVVLQSELEPVVVVLGHLAAHIEEALKSSRGLGPEKMNRLNLVFNPEFASGQAGSIRAGLKALPEAVAAALFIPGDQAGLRPVVLNRILDRARGEAAGVVIRPRYGGIPGGPVLWPRRLFAALGGLKGDLGGRSLLPDLGPAELIHLDMPEEDRPRDIDIEADYQAWLGRFAG